MNAHRKFIMLLALLIVAFYSYIAQATTVKGILIDSIGKNIRVKNEETPQVTETEEEQKSYDATSLAIIIKKGRNNLIKSRIVKFEDTDVKFDSVILEENSDLELDVSSSDPRIRRKRASYIDYKIKGFFSDNNNIYNVSRYKQKELDERKSKKREDYDLKNNYLLSLKDYYDLDLSLDARIILEAEPSQQSRNSTVVFCVLLRDKHGYLKKFAFHNAISAMSGYMRAKAKELGYDIIRAEQSHAEAQFLQFLYKRKIDRPGYYTHIVRMGSSKKHCSECNALMELLLGPNYHEITSSVNNGRENPPLPTRIVGHSSIKNENGEITLNYNTKITFNIVNGEQAIDKDVVYKRYYLPEPLKSQIKNSLRNYELDLSADRFNNSPNAAEQKKNKLSLEGKITSKVRNKLEKIKPNEITDDNINNWTKTIINDLKRAKKKIINNDNERYAEDYCKAQFEVYIRLSTESEEAN